MADRHPRELDAWRPLADLAIGDWVHFIADLTWNGRIGRVIERDRHIYGVTILTSDGRLLRPTWFGRGSLVQTTPTPEEETAWLLAELER